MSHIHIKYGTSIFLSEIHSYLSLSRRKLKVNYKSIRIRGCIMIRNMR